MGNQCRMVPCNEGIVPRSNNILLFRSFFDNIVCFSCPFCVQGHPFFFDKDTVQLRHNPGGGDVQFEGVWAANGERYRVLMRPSSPTSCSSSSSSSNGSSSSSGRKRRQLQVGAQHLKPQAASSGATGAAAAVAGSYDLAGAYQGGPKAMAFGV